MWVLALSPPGVCSAAPGLARQCVPRARGFAPDAGCDAECPDFCTLRPGFSVVCLHPLRERLDFCAVRSSPSRRLDSSPRLVSHCTHWPRSLFTAFRSQVRLCPLPTACFPVHPQSPQSHHIAAFRSAYVGSPSSLCPQSPCGSCLGCCRPVQNNQMSQSASETTLRFIHRSDAPRDLISSWVITSK